MTGGSNTVAEEDVVAHGEMVLSNAACKITGGTVASIQRIENECEIEFKYSKWKRVEIIPRSTVNPRLDSESIQRPLIAAADKPQTRPAGFISTLVLVLVHPHRRTLCGLYRHSPAAMHSCLNRLQAVFGFFTTVALVVAGFAALSVLLFPTDTTTASVQLKNVQV